CCCTIRFLLSAIALATGPANRSAQELGLLVRLLREALAARLERWRICRWLLAATFTRFVLGTWLRRALAPLPTVMVAIVTMLVTVAVTVATFSARPVEALALVTRLKLLRLVVTDLRLHIAVIT